jgi:hypothetical protein
MRLKNFSLRRGQVQGKHLQLPLAMTGRGPCPGRACCCWGTCCRRRAGAVAQPAWARGRPRCRPCRGPCHRPLASAGGPQSPARSRWPPAERPQHHLPALRAAPAARGCPASGLPCCGPCCARGRRGCGRSPCWRGMPPRAKLLLLRVRPSARAPAARGPGCPGCWAGWPAPCRRRLLVWSARLLPLERGARLLAAALPQTRPRPRQSPHPPPQRGAMRRDCHTRSQLRGLPRGPCCPELPEQPVLQACWPQEVQ